MDNLKQFGSSAWGTMRSWTSSEATLPQTQPSQPPPEQQNTSWFSLDGLSKKLNITGQMDQPAPPPQTSAVHSAMLKTAQWMESSLPALSLGQRIALFLMTLALGLIMGGLSFIYINLILVGRPEKFAFAYTMANLSLLTSSCFLVGPVSQLSSLFASHRFTAAMIYLGTLVLTLYCSWSIPSFFILVPLLVIQFGALIWYAASFVPWAHSFLSMLASPFARRAMILPL